MAMDFGEVNPDRLIERIIQRDKEGHGLEYAFTRAFGVALLCINAGFIQQGHEALQLVSEMIPKANYNSSNYAVATELRERVMLFVGAAEVEMGSLATEAVDASLLRQVREYYSFRCHIAYGRVYV